jgi:hypothetical protein
VSDLAVPAVQEDRVEDRLLKGPLGHVELQNLARIEEGGRRKEEGGRRKEKGEMRKVKGGRRQEEGAMCACT